MWRILFVGSLLAVFVTAPAGAFAAGGTLRKESARRYGVALDLPHYPQGDPQQAIRSVIRATAAGKIKYLLAHLISPTQVDEKFGGSQKALQKLAVKSSTKKSKILIGALKRQLRDGTWTIRRNLAWAKVDGLPGLSLERVGTRWFMHNTPVPGPRG